MFFNAIANAINHHNEQIRQKAIEEYVDQNQNVVEYCHNTKM